MIVSENEADGFAPLPKCFFELAHIFVTHAKDDVVLEAQLRTLIKDRWDKREAKMRTSTSSFLSQVSHLQWKYINEIAFRRTRSTPGWTT